MPTLFRVTNCFGDVRYIGPKGEEWLKGEAIPERFAARESLLEDELERRVKLWSVVQDAWPAKPEIERWE